MGNKFTHTDTHTMWGKILIPQSKIMLFLKKINSPGMCRWVACQGMFIENSLFLSNARSWNMTAVVLFSIKSYVENSNVSFCFNRHFPPCKNSFSVEIMSHQNGIWHSLKYYTVLQRTRLGPVTPFFFLISPFQCGKVYRRPPLCFGNR